MPSLTAHYLRSAGAFFFCMFRFSVSVAQQVRGLKQELLCHSLARQQATLFNSLVTSFAAGQVAKTPPYAALRSKPWGLQVRDTFRFRHAAATRRPPRE